MARQNINVGTTPNDGTGDKLNQAFTKVNANFTELYSGKEDDLGSGDNNQFLAGNREFRRVTQADVTNLTTDLGDKADKGPIADSGLEIPTARILGRTTTGTGAIETLNSLQVKTFLALDQVDNTSDASKPLSTAANAALALKQDSLPTGTNTQFLRGDKTFVAITKSDVGLNAVDNTADSSKPVFNGTTNGIVPAPGATAYSSGAKILASNGTWIDIPSGGGSGGVTSVAGKTGVVLLVKGDVGLGNVDNTSDANKPVSTATQTALDGKANTTHTHAIADVTGLQTALNGKEPTINAAATAPATKYYRGDKTWQDLDKGAVGLGNVDNTSDANKPISTATQAALDAMQDDIDALTPGEPMTQVYAVAGSGVEDDGWFPLEPAIAPFTVVIANSVVRSLNAALTAGVRTIEKNGVVIGSVEWEIGDTLGTITVPVAADLNLVAGDFLALATHDTDAAPTWESTTDGRMIVVLRN